MLVGRTEELNTLNASFQQMLEGKGNVLFLTGEAGLGKTTLVHEWWKTVSSSAFYAEAACSIPIGNVDVGTLEALQPWADVIAHLQSNEPAHGKEKKKKVDLKKLIHDAAPAWAWAIPFVGDIAHAAMETNRLVHEQREGNPNAANQQQVFQQYVNLISKVSEETPLVLLLDDMHWADTSSTNLLFYLSRQITEKKIFVVVTYRPDDALTAYGGKRHPVLQVKNEILRYSAGKELSLQYLDRAAIRSILRHTFPLYVTDDQLEQWLEKISDGNSLFITQFIKTLREDGHLNENGKFTGNYDTITIPDSALAVVEERTARLDNATRELLVYATAEGEEFTSYVLEQLTEIKPMQLLKELQQAAQAGVIEQRGKLRMFANQTTGVYGFSHALFHKALYDSLLDEQKDYLHRKCFELLKAEWDRSESARTATLASKLLTHAEKCEEWESAAEIALAIARRSLGNCAYEEAQSASEKLLQFCERLPAEKALPLRAYAFYHRGEINHFFGGNNTAIDNFKSAAALAEKAGMEDHLVLSWYMEAMMLYHKGDIETADITARNAYERAKKIGYTVGEIKSLLAIGVVASAKGLLTDALDYFLQAIAVYESYESSHV